MAAPTRVEDYLAACSEASRAALEDLREKIRTVVPGATETITYGVPTFKHEGSSLVAYAAFRDHCSLFPLSGQVVEDHDEELKPYVTRKGTIQFRPDERLPAALVEKIVRARITENAARGRR